jgi:hypothetical protein
VARATLALSKLRADHSVEYNHSFR